MIRKKREVILVQRHSSVMCPDRIFRKITARHCRWCSCAGVRIRVNGRSCRRLYFKCIDYEDGTEAWPLAVRPQLLMNCIGRGTLHAGFYCFHGSSDQTLNSYFLFTHDANPLLYNVTFASDTGPRPMDSSNTSPSLQRFALHGSRRDFPKHLQPTHRGFSSGHEVQVLRDSVFRCACLTDFFQKSQSICAGDDQQCALSANYTFSTSESLLEFK